MSTAPSSIPPPSFDVAPELPEGVERPPRPESPQWKPWMALAALVAAFGGALFGALVIGVIGSAAGSSFADPSPAVSISSTIVQDLSFIGAALLFANISARPLPEQFGLRTTRFWPAVGWMAAAFAAFYAFTLVWVAILGVSPDDTKLPDELGVKDSTYALLAVALLVAVVAPIAEEFFFRGFFYGSLRNWKGPWPAAVITGLVFGAIHVGSAEAAFLLPLGFFGFSLCLLRERTGSLYPGIALHCMNNSLAFGVSQHWGWEIPVLFACSLGLIALIGLTVRARWTPALTPAG
ncbi:MAG TPA: CPBP family intramembrane glutamic endopeptidase [Solirubrobacteraceae bacterium]